MMHQTQIVFRRMTAADLPQVALIEQHAFPTPWSEDVFQYELNNASAVCMVAETAADEQNKVIGIVIIWVVLDEAHVATMAVLEAYRNQKIGQRLLASALLACQARGSQLALLEVRRSNLAAQKLYQRFGFEFVGERKGYYQDTHEDALLMTLPWLSEEELKRLASGDA